MVSNTGFLALLGILLAVVAGPACGGTDDADDAGDSGTEDTTDVQGGGDADVIAPDTAGDVEQDAAPDVAADVAPDSGEDTATDASEDAEADTVLDVIADVTPDAVDDVESDAMADVESDTVEDVDPDIMADVTDDTSDTLDDAGDVVPDIEPDVADPCEGVVCSQPSNPCRISVCDSETGLCVSELRENGFVCADANDCRGGATCQDGACTAFDAAPNGTTCTPESDVACSLSPACRDGFCAADVYGCMADGFELLDLYDANTGEPWVPDSVGREILCPEGTLLNAVSVLYTGELSSGVTGSCMLPQFIDAELVPSIMDGPGLALNSGDGSQDSSGDSVGDCPAGHLVVGISWLPSLIGGPVSQAQVVCAPYTLVDERPEGFSFEIGTPVEPVYDAAVAGSVQTLRCGEGDVVHGFGLAASGLDPIRLACTRPQLFLARSGPGSPSSNRVDDRVIMCPYGSALVGFGAQEAVGFYSGFTTSATAICRQVVPDFSGESSRFTWGEPSIANQLPLGILAGAGDATVTCPEDTWMYSATFSGQRLFFDTSLLTGAVINCAPLFQLPAIEFGERSFWVIDTADTTTVTFGAPGSQGVVFNECPPGQSVVGIWSFSGEIWDNVALMCSQRYPIAIPE